MKFVGLFFERDEGTKISKLSDLQYLLSTLLNWLKLLWAVWTEKKL